MDDMAARTEDDTFAPDARWATLAKIALDNAIDGILIHTTGGEVVFFNEAAARNLGFTPDEFAKLPPWSFAGEFTLDELQERVERIKRAGKLVFPSPRTLPDGTRATIEVHARWVETEFGPLIVSVSHDITEQADAYRRLQHLAFHDALTDVSNRARFDARLEEAIAEQARNGIEFGIVYMDMDGFKDINDTDGHSTGDLVLRALAQRLRHSVRASDTVARFGGDEFVAIIRNVANLDSLRSIADKLCDRVAEPLAIEDREYVVHASCGCALYDPKTDTAHSVVMRADIDMYERRKAARTLE